MLLTNSVAITCYPQSVIQNAQLLEIRIHYSGLCSKVQTKHGSWKIKEKEGGNKQST
jgi:hypothetical protein